MKNKHTTTAHAKHTLRYHIIFSTKFRRKCLDSIKNDVFDSFRYGESISDYKILNMNIDNDHIHFIMKWKPSLSIEQVVRRMKQCSTKYLWDKCDSYLTKVYWKKKQIWTGGYFCSTIGEVSEANIISYIENQG